MQRLRVPYHSYLLHERIKWKETGLSFSEPSLQQTVPPPVFIVCGKQSLPVLAMANSLSCKLSFYSENSPPKGTPCGFKHHSELRPAPPHGVSTFTNQYECYIKFMRYIWLIDKAIASLRSWCPNLLINLGIPHAIVKYSRYFYSSWTY